MRIKTPGAKEMLRAFLLFYGILESRPLTSTAKFSEDSLEDSCTSSWDISFCIPAAVFVKSSGIPSCWESIPLLPCKR